ncbi:MAG: efflux RND transporter periplasmic adaptor subunit [Acinetobacter sp.]|nr:efflux RND transporter periplasmic adaptor subunit [Acinetobacter sp.]
MTNLKRSALSICALAVSIALVGCGGNDEQQTQQTAAAAAPKATPVGVMIAQAQPVENFVELAGRANAYEVSQVRPQATGVILKRLFAEGSFVQAGQPLYELDSRSGRADVENMQAAIARHTANIDALRKKEGRYRQLVGTNAIAQQDYDDIVAQLRLAEADLKAAQANLKTSQIALGFSVIRAPISGQTSRSAVTAGALVTNGQADALVTIQRLNPIYIDINQSSAEVLRLRQQISQGNIAYTGNAVVKLKLEDGSEYPLEGKLTFADASVNESTGSVTLRAVFPNPNHLLLPGMYATAKISQGVLPKAYLIPQAAVTRNATGSATVLVVGADSKVVSRTVKTQMAQGDKWVITEGINDGDKIIIAGNAKVKEGDLVEAQALESSATTAAPNTLAAQDAEKAKNAEAAKATEAAAEPTTSNNNAETTEKTAEKSAAQ